MTDKRSTTLSNTELVEAARYFAELYPKEPVGKIYRRISKKARPHVTVSSFDGFIKAEVVNVSQGMMVTPKLVTVTDDVSVETLIFELAGKVVESQFATRFYEAVTVRVPGQANQVFDCGPRPEIMATATLKKGVLSILVMNLKGPMHAKGVAKITQDGARIWQKDNIQLYTMQFFEAVIQATEYDPDVPLVVYLDGAHPLSLPFPQETKASFSIGKLVWNVSEGGGEALVIPVQNDGEGHAVLAMSVLLNGVLLFEEIIHTDGGTTRDSFVYGLDQLGVIEIKIGTFFQKALAVPLPPSLAHTAPQLELLSAKTDGIKYRFEYALTSPDMTRYWNLTVAQEGRDVPLATQKVMVKNGEKVRFQFAAQVAVDPTKPIIILTDGYNVVTQELPAMPEEPLPVIEVMPEQWGLMEMFRDGNSLMVGVTNRRSVTAHSRIWLASTGQSSIPEFSLTFQPGETVIIPFNIDLPEGLQIMVYSKDEMLGHVVVPKLGFKATHYVQDDNAKKLVVELGWYGCSMEKPVVIGITTDPNTDPRGGLYTPGVQLAYGEIRSFKYDRAEIGQVLKVTSHGHLLYAAVLQAPPTYPAIIHEAGEDSAQVVQLPSTVATLAGPFIEIKEFQLPSPEFRSLFKVTPDFKGYEVLITIERIGPDMEEAQTVVITAEPKNPRGKFTHLIKLVNGGVAKITYQNGEEGQDVYLKIMDEVIHSFRIQDKRVVVG